MLNNSLEQNRMNRPVLVFFTDPVLQKPASWWRQFGAVIGPRTVAETAEKYNLEYIDIESLLLPGSIQDAEVLVRTLSVLTNSEGQKISKMGSFDGYDLWWIHYDDLYYRYCFPYTQYKLLLTKLSEFTDVHLYNPSSATLFNYYLEAHGCAVHVIGAKEPKFPNVSLWIQAALSLLYFLVLVVQKPRLMVWTSDLFDPPHDYDFRMRYIYEELRRKKTPFVEFIRSIEPWRTVIEHAIRRNRPVVYSHALATILRLFAGYLAPGDSKKVQVMFPKFATAEDKFRFLVATHYLRTVTGDRWAIRLMEFILVSIGVQTAIITTAVSRSFHEVIACKRRNIPTVGILHGIASKDYNVYDFMPEFEGTKPMSLDLYGVWSSWWKEYYLHHGVVYTPEQLIVSGPMRPLLVERLEKSVRTDGQVRVLFISEQLGTPSETVPYLEALLSSPGIEVYIKFRSYRDGFESWLMKNRPDILERVPESRILRTGMSEAIAVCDVVVGSHSTAVVEALLYLKPPVLFSTSKWGDYFSLKTLNLCQKLIADTPEEFIELIYASTKIEEEVLLKLQNRLFGDPHMNGSFWVVSKAEQLLSVKNLTLR